jgi:hemerythrin-like domain-containing protein
MSGIGLVLDCRKGDLSRIDPTRSAAASPLPAGDASLEGEEPDVTATEDLMREHGVIRRALIVYREAAIRVRAKPTRLPADALHKTATLLRTFAEDYHEKQLEEAHIFPALKRAGGPASRDVDTLIAQHQRGREITDYVLAVTRGPIGSASADPVARTLESFARMYEEHAALEDTVIFPAWKKTMSDKELDQMGDLFEDIEHKTFGKDGFEEAVKQMEAIERAFDLDLAHFTAPPPPKA